MVLAQILVASVVRVFDVASDVYVVWLWHQAGRARLVNAGVSFLLLTVCVAAVLGSAALQREEGHAAASWVYLVLSPFNLQTLVWAVLVLAARRRKAKAGANANEGLDAGDGVAYFNFTFYNGWNAVAESLPFALMTGVDLLTGGGAVGALVKWSSLVLSVLSICFSMACLGCSLNKLSGERAVEVFCLLLMDVVWLITALAWTIGALGPARGGLAIGAAFGSVWIALPPFFLWLNDPSKRSLAAVHDIMIPFRKALMLHDDVAVEMVAGTPGFVWVNPAVALISSLISAPCLLVTDAMLTLTDTQIGWVRDGYAEASLALLRRGMLSALTVTHIVASPSRTRLGVSVAIAGAHAYFSLRVRGHLRRFGLSALLTCAVHAVSTPLDAAECSVKEVSPEQLAQARAKLQNEPPPPPGGFALSGEEEEFIAQCHHILAAETKASARRGGDAALAVAWQQFVQTVEQAAQWASSSGALQRCKHLKAVTRLLKASYTRPSEAGLMACTRALVGLLQEDRLHELDSAPHDPADEAASSLPPPLRVVSFCSVARSAVWHRDFDDAAALELAPPVGAAGGCVDFFVSHARSDDPAAKAALLRTFLFLQPFAAETIACTLLLAMACVPGGFIATALDARVPWWALSVGVCGIGALVLAWAVGCHAADAAGHHFAVPWRGVTQTFWLDKCCIDQRTDAAKQRGIAHLGDSLQRSRAMLVIFSPTYLERLWCTYELAEYCRLMETERSAPVDGEPAEPKQLLMLSLSWGTWWYPWNLLRPVSSVQLSPTETALLDGYRCGAARAYKRDDREVVLRKIRALWSDDAELTNGEDVFDAYVRTRVKAVLLAHKRDYYRQARIALWHAVVILFR